MTAIMEPAMEPSFDVSSVVSLPEDSFLRAFNRAGVLAPADVHVALRIGRLGGDDDELVALAVAFAVRAPRVGHVRVDLGHVRETAEGEVEDEVDLDSLPWPDPDEWARRVAASSLVAVGDDDGAGTAGVAPIRLVGSALYLDRYWRDERAVAADLVRRAATEPGEADFSQLSVSIERLFGGEEDGEQRLATAVAALRGLAVVAGGPGTGKTTTVARIIGLLASRAEDAGFELPLVALAAPTGKAANRMQEAVHAAASSMEVSETTRAHLLGLEAATVHRLLRARPDSASRFRYNRRNHLPHDVVIVDETSMLSLWLMARLVEAVRRDARLVLVGDPEQLASVEAGAVLGDIVGPASKGLRMSSTARSQLEAATGVVVPVPPAGQSENGGSAIGNGVVVLRTNHRFAGALAALAAGIRSGSADAVVAALGTGDPNVEWLPVDAAEADQTQLDPVRRLACDTGERLVRAAQAGEGEVALDALGSWRILCAHRRGPAGVAAWNARVEQWLSAEVEGYSADGEWYVGRPVIVTANDYSLRLFNGDTGVVVARQPAGVTAAFERGPISPSRLSGVDTVYAMTVHKAQGSEFDQVAVVLPQPTSRILTRELLYTAVTRAKARLLLIGTEEAVRAAVERPIARSSGLTERLWVG